jgi:chromosome segregation ATPase
MEESGGIYLGGYPPQAPIPAAAAAAVAPAPAAAAAALPQARITTRPGSSPDQDIDLLENELGEVRQELDEVKATLVRVRAERNAARAKHVDAYSHYKQMKEERDKLYERLADAGISDDECVEDLLAGQSKQGSWAESNAYNAQAPSTG